MHARASRPTSIYSSSSSSSSSSSQLLLLDHRDPAADVKTQKLAQNWEKPLMAYSSSSSVSRLHSTTAGIKLHLFVLSLLSLSLSLFVLTSTFTTPKPTPPIIIHHIQNLHSDRSALHFSINNSINNQIRNITTVNYKQKSPFLDFLEKEFAGKKKSSVKIALLSKNKHDHDEKEELEGWERLGETTEIHFDRVSEEISWDELFPEWIDEEEKWKKPKCKNIPMPWHEDYGDQFDVIVARLPPCRSVGYGVGVNGFQVKEGIRDVFMLQVNLAVANLVVKNGRKDQQVYVVFVSPSSSSSAACGPMWEIFRCDDLILSGHHKEGDDDHDNQFWVYKPELKRLKQKVLMPVGSCQLAVAQEKKKKKMMTNRQDADADDGDEFNYDFSKLVNPIGHPREAYATVLHSSEAYVCGAIALAQSIIQTNSTKDLVLLADQSITDKSRQALRAAGWKIRLIDRIRSPYAKENAYNQWNYSKLRIWQLTEYDKVIFIDSDFIILKNIDSFFSVPQISASGNDKFLFNSGIMLIEPSKCMFQMLMKKRYSLVSYNGGDQGFLNEAFTWWHRLPSRLNYLKIYRRFKYTQRQLPKTNNLPYAVHYLGLKPWMCYKDYDCNWDMQDHHVFASDYAHWRWWEVYDKMPKRLQASCGLSKKMDARIKKWRGRAKVANLSDGHWKIKVNDPRQHRQIEEG